MTRPVEFCTGVYVFADRFTIERTPSGAWTVYAVPEAGRSVQTTAAAILRERDLAQSRAGESP